MTAGIFGLFSNRSPSKNKWTLLELQISCMVTVTKKRPLLLHS